LPVKQPERNEKIRQLEAKARKGETQIFIETPYRNNALIHDVLQNSHADTWFCIASDITGEKESIETKKIAEWKKQIPAPGKIPAIFLIG
jgi:16S rRNA (cytidine1402-2'-O)-methyltransferase